MRPENWNKGECEGCKRRIDDEFGEFFCDISCGEHSAQVNYEAGADAILTFLLSSGIISLSQLEELGKNGEVRHRKGNP